MPKSVLCDKKEIYERVKKLFLVSGYTGVDIKTIAQECKMAVGTFYNYYENKEEIFCEIINDSWEVFFDTIKDKKTLFEFIKNIYFYMKYNKGFGITFKSIPIEKAVKVNDLYNAILNEVSDHIIGFIKVEYKTIARRLALSLFMSIILFVGSDEFDDESNLDFICNLFMNYCD